LHQFSREISANVMICLPDQRQLSS
jgi:hypothetical protein